MRRIALGRLGMDPDRFWTMTLDEFLDVLDGHVEQEDLHWSRAAWMVSRLLAPHVPRGERVPTPNELLGRPAPEPDPFEQAAAEAKFDAMLGLAQTSGMDVEQATNAAQFDLLAKKLESLGRPMLPGGET